MRTPEQIANNRKVLESMIGIFAKFLTDEEVNAWADRIQQQVDSIEYYWIVRVFISDDQDTPVSWHDTIRPMGFRVQDIKWEYIPTEDVRPFGNFKTVVSSFENLMKKYPQIKAVMIRPVDPDDGTEIVSSSHVIEKQ